MKTFRTSAYVLPARRSCPALNLVAPVPRPFEFGFKERRPLVPLSAVRSLLNRDSRELTVLIEDGRLRWAFDIRSRGAARREMRVLWQSVLEFAGLWPRPAVSRRSEAEEFASIIRLILPDGTTALPDKPAPTETEPQTTSPTPVLTGSEVAHCFSCLNQHVLNLLRENSLQKFNRSGGPKASPLVIRASVIKFLSERRIS